MAEVDAQIPSELSQLNIINSPSYDPITKTKQQIVKDSLENRMAIADIQTDVHLEKIIVLDNAKNVYSDIIRNIDTSLLNKLDEVNNSIGVVNDAYQARIDGGCRTDLFWRLTSIEEQTTPSTGGKGPPPETKRTYTYTCVRLNPNGYEKLEDPDTKPGRKVPILKTPAETNSQTGVSTAHLGAVQYIADSNYRLATEPLDSLFGLQAVNLYGLKVYDEPYTHDIGDTYVTSFIGTCGVGTNVIVAMTSDVLSGTVNIQPGQILTCSKPFVFPTDSAIITGIGTTIANLSGINTISNFDSTSQSVVPKLTIDDNTTQDVFAPDDEGNYVIFTVLKSPDSFGNLAIDKTSSPYVPQTIKMMKRADIGVGTRVQFDNSGAPNVDQPWNPFLEGQPDPSVQYSPYDIQKQFEENAIKEPSVGAGKIYHRVAFTIAPVLFSDRDGTSYELAKEGDTVRIVDAEMGQSSSSIFNLRVSKDGIPGVVVLPTCPDLEDTLQLTINKSNELVAGLSTAIIQDKIQVVNELRKDVNDLNLRIWNERMQIGDAEERKTTYEDRLKIINENADIINGVI